MFSFHMVLLVYDSMYAAPDKSIRTSSLSAFECGFIAFMFEGLINQSVSVF